MQTGEVKGYSSPPWEELVMEGGGAWDCRRG